MIKVQAPSTGASTGSFLRHFLEMVLAMVAGMFLLGALLRIGVLVIGDAGFYEHTVARALIMTVNMTIGMGLWMRHRGHDRLHVAEMAGAMFVPLAILVYPYCAGLLSRGALMGGMHVLMLPAMVAVMLYRRDVYSQHHGLHTPDTTLASEG